MIYCILSDLSDPYARKLQRRKEEEERLKKEREEYRIWAPKMKDGDV